MTISRISDMGVRPDASRTVREFAFSSACGHEVRRAASGFRYAASPTLAGGSTAEFLWADNIRALEDYASW